MSKFFAVAWCAIVIVIGPSLGVADNDAVFSKIVSPFVAKHCVSCHGSKKQKGELRLDGLDGRRTNRVRVVPGWLRS